MGLRSASDAPDPAERLRSFLHSSCSSASAAAAIREARSPGSRAPQRPVPHAGRAAPRGGARRVARREGGGHRGAQPPDIQLEAAAASSAHQIKRPPLLIIPHIFTRNRWPLLGLSSIVVQTASTPGRARSARRVHPWLFFFFWIFEGTIDHRKGAEAAEAPQRELEMEEQGKPSAVPLGASASFAVLSSRQWEKRRRSAAGRDASKPAAIAERSSRAPRAACDRGPHVASQTSSSRRGVHSSESVDPERCDQ